MLVKEPAIQHTLKEIERLWQVSAGNNPLRAIFKMDSPQLNHDVGYGP